MFAADARWPTAAATAILIAVSGLAAEAQTARRDGIAELLRLAETGADKPPVPGRPQVKPDQQAQPQQPVDPRQGEAVFEQARRLMREIDGVLRDAAEHRSQAQKLPGRDEFILTPLWTETREDRETRIRGLLIPPLALSPMCPWWRCSARSRSCASTFVTSKRRLRP